MKTLEYQVMFNTPAFLGNAQQSGQWRTPPFKALLRQWWRVVYAADHGYQVDVAAMRREEGMLFGNAWLSHSDGYREVADHCKSLVRLRLSHWDLGKLKQWPTRYEVKVTHPEVTTKDGRTVPIGSQLYLGYGPLTARRRDTVLKHNAAIQEGESATLLLAAPDEGTDTMRRALWLMDRYGTLGGRSRNGWGSVSLVPEAKAEPGTSAMDIPLRPWREALDRDWPHAIGQDARGPLIWQTEPFGRAQWNALMRDLAVVKIGLRTQFRFRNRPGERTPEDRHWISHPVTHHNVRAWGQGRLPNSLRFKVRPAPTDPGKLVGIILHVPCRPPRGFDPDLNAIEDVWRQVHAFLDSSNQQVTRVTE